MSQRTYWDEARPNIFRCAECGKKVSDPAQVDPESVCSNCGADLHCCRACAFFDPSAESECREQVESRIAKKRENNDCSLFRPLMVVDLMGGDRAVSAADARRKAFDDLFK